MVRSLWEPRATPRSPYQYSIHPTVPHESLSFGIHRGGHRVPARTGLRHHRDTSPRRALALDASLVLMWATEGLGLDQASSAGVAGSAGRNCTYACDFLCGLNQSVFVPSMEVRQHVHTTQLIEADQRRPVDRKQDSRGCWTTFCWVAVGVGVGRGGRWAW